MIHFIPTRWLRFICTILLRRVYDDEENEELKGICKATGVSMFLLVCFNVLLDLFMGCSSGAAAIRNGEDMKSGSKMVHFRTLDWGMPALRRVVVQLDYVSEKDGPIIASSITYAGFVGVLTGVRKDLSMSLNFRPHRIDNGKFWSDLKYDWHLLMVLLAKRPSISTQLRKFLLPQRQKVKRVSWLPFTKKGEIASIGYSDVVKKIGGDGTTAKPTTTSACYLCFCNGKETTVVEKDRVSAKVRTSEEFIIVTNADDNEPHNEENEEKKKTQPARTELLQEIFDEAQDRQQCALHNWRNMRVAKSKRIGLHFITEEDRMTLSELDDVIAMVQKYPTTNECTHFACVMDPTDGDIKWCRRWMEPVSAKWIREHMSETW